MRGQLSTADSLLQKALQLSTENDKVSAEGTICLNELGTLALRNGNTTRALQYYRAALQGFKSQNPIIHRDVAVVLNHIALVYMRFGDFDSTDYYFAGALTTLRQYYAESHFNLGMVYGNMAIAADMRGWHSQAAEYCNKSTGYFRAHCWRRSSVNRQYL